MRMLFRCTVIAVFCALASAILAFNPLALPAHAQNVIVVAQSGISEKEAYEAAKELGTIEAWEAFLENFPKGFRADLARAYLKRIASEDAPASDEKPAPAEMPVAETPPPPPHAPADISLAMTSQGACSGGQNCNYMVTATNGGGEVFASSLVITTTIAPGGAELQGTGTPPFSCEGLGGGAICSSYSVNLAPGQSATLPMTFSLPRNAGGQVTACASVEWGGVPSGLGPAEVQRKLNELGFDAGPVDGQPGRQTVNAIKDFQQSAGMQDTGELDLPLYITLFSEGGPGDANPQNDQACAGAAVTQAPPLPAAYQPPPGPSCPLGQIITSSGACGCPSSVPVWTGTSCIPRVTRNCKGGTYYNKGQGLCLCPSSRPHWYNNRCHARFDDCPGDSVRVGDKCLKSNDPGFAARGRGPGQRSGGGCPANTTRIGNSCIAVNLAPLFNFGNNKPKGGGSGNKNKTFSGGNRPNRPQGGGQNQKQPLTATKQTACVPGTMLRDGKCQPLQFTCPDGSTPLNFKCPGLPQQGGQPKCPAGQTFTPGFGCAQMADPKGLPQPCPKNQFWSNGKCQLANTVPVTPPPPPPPPILKGGGQTATQQGGALKCPTGEVASLWGCVKGPVPNCPPGVLHQVTADRRVLCDTAQAPQPNPNPPPPPIVKRAAGNINCPKGQKAQGTPPNMFCTGTQPAKTVNGKKVCPAGWGYFDAAARCLPYCTKPGQGGDCIASAPPKPAPPPPPPPPPAAAGIKCGPGMQPQGNTCVSINKPGATTSKQIICPSNLVPQNGRCGCAPGLKWNGRSCATPQQKTQQPVQQQKVIQQQAAPAPKGCSGGQVRQANGNCACPNGMAYVNKKCQNLGQVLQGNQNQQQQGQGQQGQKLSPQQQQQLQQGLNKLNQFLSDRRAKRDVVQVATREDGLKLYSFRYLWSDVTLVGVMAQDLLNDPVKHDAVSLHESGYYQVDYAMLGMKMLTLEEWRALNTRGSR